MPMRTVRSRRSKALELLESRLLLTSVVVNTLDDYIHTSGSAVSIRDALNIANNSSSPTTITFDPTVFATPKTIQASQTLVFDNFFASNTLTITGPSAPLMIDFSGSQLNQQGAFEIYYSYDAATISNLTVANSNTGGFLDGGILTLNNVVMIGNSVLGPRAAGMTLDGKSLTATNCTIEDNHADSPGGGVVFSEFGQMTLVDCTISGNTSSDPAMGLFNYGSATLTNVTINGNSGGGIEKYPAGKQLSLTNVTISGNTGIGVGDFPGQGSSPFDLGNSAIAGNSGGDVSGSFTSKGHNLIGDGGGSGTWLSSDLVGSAAHHLNPLLGALANNGGPTQTMLPLAGSPLIDHGSNALIPSGTTTDQRGLPRIVGSSVDIGAVEVQTSKVVTGSISGSAFNDANGNGKVDTGEKGIAGRTVYIDKNKNGKLDAGEPTAITSSTGTYSFKNLAAGTYRVRQVLPSGWRVTSPSAGYFDVTVSAGQSITGKNFLDTQKALISGVVFHDTNANGMQNTGETGLSGWVVFLDTNNNGKLDPGERSFTTGADGKFSFIVSAGTYHLREVLKSGFKRTTPSTGAYTITLSNGQTATGKNFGDH